MDIKFGMENFSEDGFDNDKVQSCPSVRMMKEHGSFTMQQHQLNKLTETVEKLNSDMTTWKKMIEEDAKSRKLDLKNCLKDMESVKLDVKNCLEIQKDTVKSFLSMKKEISAN